MFNILFYGDSNTWGFDPVTCGRYPYEKRWTSICAQILGPDYNCIASGMNGRTTAFDDPIKGSRNGTAGLDYALQTHKPLDLIVVMLGTNDLKFTDASGSAGGMEKLIRQIVTANERYNLSSPVFDISPGMPNPVLLISPVLVEGKLNDSIIIDEVTESRKLAGLYAEIADRNHTYFMDAAVLTNPSETDGIHLDTAGHEIIGKAAAEKIISLLH